MSSYSRYSDKQRHSGSDYSRSSRSSHSSKRSEDSLKRRKERDRHDERLKERRRSSPRSSDRNYTRREESGISRKESRIYDSSKKESKISRSRSKADRTYNTDTEESDESSDNHGRYFKRRHSSDQDYDKLHSDGKDEEVTSNITSTNQLSTKVKDLNQVRSTNRKDVERNRKTVTSENVSTGLSSISSEENDSRSVGPSLPPHFQRNGSPDSCKDESNSDGPGLPAYLQRKFSPDGSENGSFSVGPVLPPHLQRKGSPNSSEDESNSVGPVLPAHLQRKILPDSSEDQSNSVGPILPPHLHRKGSPDSSEDESNSVSPILPPHLLRKGSPETSASIGPVLPPHLKENASSDSDDDGASIGPVLPPSARKNDSEDGDSKCIGPALPPHLQRSSSPDSQDEPAYLGPALPPGLKQNSSRTLGPSLPPGMTFQNSSESEDSEDEVVGPMLPEELIQSNKNYLIHAQLERRAAEVKRKMEEKDMGPEVTKREQWMLELPPEGTINLGLGPRTFRVKGAPEKGADRSMWTDTPADKLRKQEEAARDCEGTSRSAEVPPEISLRDKEMEKIVKKHSKKRGKESLLDLHQKELNKKKKDKDVDKKEERRPFSREVDLQTHVFDEAQKKSIFKKAQLLDTRFSRGETKYL